MHNSYTVRAIGTAHSPYTQKFGIPRQPQLAPAAQTRIVLDKQFGADCVRGLDGFEYIWVQFLFHDAVAEGWAELVRPPRLGGRKKTGVFASRSPHRPNHIGLSLMRLTRIDTAGKQVEIWCEGGDLLDGTPVLDIKPYLPFAEAKPDAASGYVQGAPAILAVRWQPESGADALPAATRALVEQVVAQDPRPAYQDEPSRVYGMEIAGLEVRFTIANGEAFVWECKKAA